jgi:hypothetical protein
MPNRTAARRKAWQPPRLARLHAGSAESGISNNEDGDFTAS